jgi:hypothetical protein
MVKAILERRKTQTRRVNKLERLDGESPYYETREGDLIPIKDMCPYGQVGDKLWVRETFYVQPDIYSAQFPTPIHYKADAGLESYEDYILKPSIFMPRWASRLTLEITDIRVQRLQEISTEDCISEGLYISSADGMKLASMDMATWYHKRYQLLWDSINGKPKQIKTPTHKPITIMTNSWESNCWVWAISFKVQEGKE